MDLFFTRVPINIMKPDSVCIFNGPTLSDFMASTETRKSSYKEEELRKSIKVTGQFSGDQHLILITTIVICTRMKECINHEWFQIRFITYCAVVVVETLNAVAGLGISRSTGLLYRDKSYKRVCYPKRNDLHSN